MFPSFIRKIHVFYNPLKRRFHNDYKEPKKSIWVPFILLQLIIQPIIMIGIHKLYIRPFYMNIEDSLTDKDLEKWGNVYDNIYKIMNEFEKRDRIQKVKEMQKKLELEKENGSKKKE